MARVLVPLAAGFEEIEAVTIIDVLRRAGVEVVVAGLDGAGSVQGSHAIAIMAPHALADVLQQSFDLVLLPGGEPGTTALAADASLGTLLDRHRAAGGPVAAICAAPRVLASRGMLQGLRATSHPSVETQVRAGGAAYSTERVVRDGQVLTSRGPGTALEFALAALDLLGETARAADLHRAMLAPDR